MHAIGPDNHVTLLHDTFGSFDGDALWGIIDGCDFPASLDERLVWEAIPENLQKFSTLKKQNVLTMAVFVVSLPNPSKTESRYSLFPNIVKEAAVNQDLAVWTAIFEPLQRLDCLLGCFMDTKLTQYSGTVRVDGNRCSLGRSDLASFKDNVIDTGFLKTMRGSQTSDASADDNDTEIMLSHSDECVFDRAMKRDEQLFSENQNFKSYIVKEISI